MRAGQLNRRVDVQRAVDADDGHGGQSRGWATIASAVGVNATQIGGKEALQAGALQQRQDWRIVMRRRDLRSTDRLLARRWPGLADGAELNVRSVADYDGTGRWLLVFADTGPTG